MKNGKQKSVWLKIGNFRTLRTYKKHGPAIKSLLHSQIGSWGPSNSTEAKQKEIRSLLDMISSSPPYLSIVDLGWLALYVDWKMDESYPDFDKHVAFLYKAITTAPVEDEEIAYYVDKEVYMGPSDEEKVEKSRPFLIPDTNTPGARGGSPCHNSSNPSIGQKDDDNCEKAPEQRISDEEVASSVDQTPIS